jgi:hypothetical protein
MLDFLSIDPLAKMATAAGWQGVRTCKYKSGFCMIEGHFTPSGRIMAGFTGRTRIIFRADEGKMDILMTIGTLHSDLPETPLFLLFMACKTGSCKMCPLKLECSEVMLLQRE